MISFKNALLAGVVALGALTTTSASAQSLELDYSVTPKAGNLFHYDFTLRLANQDNSWAPGQQWDWITFGDADFPGPSPISDFFNFASSDPQASLTFSGGGHNGPTIAYGPNSVVLPGWEPSAIGATLMWSGDSVTRLGAGQLLFSTLVTGNGAVRSDFQVANLVSGAVPEPATWAMMIGGIGMVGGAMRRRKVSATVSFA
jgi:hypothetical protein